MVVPVLESKMASNFDSMFGEASPLLSESFGTVTGVDYVAPDGTTTNDIVATVGALRLSESMNEGGVGNEYERLVKVNTDPDHATYAGIETVSIGGRIVIDDVTYAIASIDSQTPTFHTLRCVKVDRVEISMKDFRRSTLGR